MNQLITGMMIINASFHQGKLLLVYYHYDALALLTDLGGNNLTTPPESMGSIQVGGHLYLGKLNNKLTTLPESMGSMKVGVKIGGGLSLISNKLTSLPESMGSMTAGPGILVYR